MAGASFEVALELWASSLREAKARMRPLFLQERMARSAGLFLDGLLGAERRKTGWMRAEAAGDPGPWRQQAILGPWPMGGGRLARRRARVRVGDARRPWRRAGLETRPGFLSRGKA
jgi:SRSO17 transposase